ncbi:MAG: hypothetical protein JNJ57_10700 [Saprospiraceae bacterium]|nr:hypothetical protein [Saprospiraceae bacterium]
MINPIQKSLFQLCCLLFAGLLTLSCNKDNGLPPGFPVLYRQDFIIPVGLSEFQVHHFQLQNISTRYLQELTDHSKTDADILGFTTSKASLTGIYGDSDLDFIDQVSLRVYDEADPNDYIEIAYRYPVPFEPGNTLPLIPSLADSKRMFSKSRISIDIVIWLRKITPVENEMRLDLEMWAQI